MLRDRVEPGSALYKGVPPLIDIKGVTKEYKTQAGSFAALKGVDLRVQAGEFVTVVGKSGSGKSTLLNIVAGIDRPSTGEVYVGGVAVHQLNETLSATWRGRNVGVVFQFFQLLPTLTVLENVILPMDFCGSFPVREREPRAMQLLQRVGLEEHVEKLPAALSGGEQQRAAIARALANDPPIIVADEPTGNLDSQTAGMIVELFRGLVEVDKTVVMVTHEKESARDAKRLVRLADGIIVEDDRQESRTASTGDSWERRRYV